MDPEWKFTAVRYDDRIYPGRYSDDPESVGRDPYVQKMGSRFSRGVTGTKIKAKVPQIPTITRLKRALIVVIQPLMFFNSNSHSILP